MTFSEKSSPSSTSPSLEECLPAGSKRSFFELDPSTGGAVGRLPFLDIESVSIGLALFILAQKEIKETNVWLQASKNKTNWT